MAHTEQQKIAIRAQFALKRRRQYLLVVPFLLVYVCVFLARRTEDGSLWGLSSFVWAPLAAAFAIGALIFSFRNWRCPACHKYLGREINPSFCPKCGVPLR